MTLGAKKRKIYIKKYLAFKVSYRVHIPAIIFNECDGVKRLLKETIAYIFNENNKENIANYQCN